MNKRDKIEPASTAMTSFVVRSRHARVVFVLGAATAYNLVLNALYSRMGPGLAALSGLPVIAAGWLLGLRAGLVAWFLFLPVNTLLFNMVGLLGWDTVFHNGGGPGTLVTVIIVAVAGRLRDVREQLNREISERKLAEEALKRANDQLEDRVKQRTAELQDANKHLQSEIADRKQVEKRETQLGRIVEESLNEIFIFDAKTFRFLEVNRGARENLGYSMQELSAMTPLDVKPQVTPEKFMEIAAPLLNGEQKRVDFETVHRRKDGSLYNVEAHLQLAELDNKPVFVAFVRDITKRKQLEEEAHEHQERLAHVTRLSTMGEMATGLAHELNQPLAAISTYSYAGERVLAGTGSAAPEQLRELFEKMAAQAMRAGKIIRRLRALVGKRASVRSWVDVIGPIQEVLDLLEPDLRQNEVCVELRADHSSRVVMIDEIQIQQVLVNLIRNALDAMSETERDQRTLKITTSRTADDLIEVAVSDTGTGIPVESANQVFDAFFSSKSDGMGMGLAISRTIIESHGGRLWMTPNSEGGVTFHFTLPTTTEGSDDGGG